MRLSVVSRHLPLPEGGSNGRALLAWVEGALTEGHEVDVWSWSPDPPPHDLPSWCTWRPLPREPWLHMKARALVHPRSDVVIDGWAPHAGWVPVADDPISFPAVARFDRPVLTVHYLTRFDAPAVGRRSARDIQDLRAERRDARRAAVVIAHSDRVAATIGVPAASVPLAYPVPDIVLPLVDQPVAVLLADWRWPPNQRALRVVLEAWTSVRERVAGAKLILAGRGMEAGEVSEPGVRAIGPVARAIDALGMAAVLPFPCPPSSGPKVKVLEAMAYGVPVLTTDHGAEGIFGTAGREALVVAGEAGFGDALAALLADPGRRAAIAAAGRRAAVEHHAPVPAARAKLAAISEGRR